MASALPIRFFLAKSTIIPLGAGFYKRGRVPYDDSAVSAGGNRDIGEPELAGFVRLEDLEHRKCLLNKLILVKSSVAHGI